MNGLTIGFPSALDSVCVCVCVWGIKILTHGRRLGFGFHSWCTYKIYAFEFRGRGFMHLVNIYVYKALYGYLRFKPGLAIMLDQLPFSSIDCSLVQYVYEYRTMP